MTIKGWKKKAFLFIIIGGIQYIILIFVASVFYAGGTGNNPAIPGYSFWANSLSDLGRTVAYSGLLNTISMVIFTITTSIWGFSLILFFISFRSFFKEQKKLKISSTFGSLFGIVTGMCLIGIAFTPADVLGAPHMFFVYIGYTSILLVGILYTIALYWNQNFPKIYTCTFLIFTIIFFITTLIALVGLGANQELLAIGQKIGRYTTINKQYTARKS